jgi:hypothetical protein
MAATSFTAAAFVDHDDRNPIGSVYIQPDQPSVADPHFITSRGPPGISAALAVLPSIPRMQPAVGSVQMRATTGARGLCACLAVAGNCKAVRGA